jgi:hypothetical protein
VIVMPACVAFQGQPGGPGWACEQTGDNVQESCEKTATRFLLNGRDQRRLFHACFEEG